MILSHHRQFIFLKTRKTAGTSVEIALSKHCGRQDVITPFSPTDEELRQQVGGRGPQNHLGAHNHMPAKRVRSVYGRPVWRQYYKFTIERNPWDAMVSSYFFIYRHLERPPFADFVANRASTFKRNSDIYRIRQQIAVDRVCLYESLTDDLEEVRNELRLPERLDLPFAKGGFRTDRHYRELYGPVEVELVRQLNADTIEAFGYEF